jgi:hypothetical protein
MTTAQQNTYQMLRAYVQGIKAPGFLSGLFQAPPENFHNQKQVQIDLSLEAENVATPVDTVGSEYNKNNSSTHQELEVTPPIYKESEVIPIDELYNRQVGANPYQDNDVQVNGVRLALKAAERLANKVGRALELQASQILTSSSGLSLIDDSGAVKYALNYNLSGTLFPTAATPWSSSGTAAPIDDLMALCVVIRGGGNDPTWCIMDGYSLEAAMKVTSFKERFTPIGANFAGALNPMSNPGSTGGNYRGSLQVGHWRLDVYTYGAMYRHPQTGTMTPYIPRKKVVVGSNARMDATFGNVPRFPGEQQALQYLPARITSSNGRMDLNFNAWFSADRTALNIGVGARPLLIPTDKFAFGCLDTDLA